MKALSDEQELKLYKDWLIGEFTKTDLAKLYGIGRTTVRRIITDMEAKGLLDEDLSEPEDNLEEFPEFPEELEELDYDGWGSTIWDEEETPDVSNPDEVSDFYQYNVVATPKNIFISRYNKDTGVVDDVNITPSNQRFDDVLNKIIESPTSQQVLHDAFNQIDIATAIKILSHGHIVVDAVAGKVSYIGEDEEFAFKGSLADRLINQVSKGIDCNNLLNFADKLGKSQSFTVVNRIYEFIKATDIDIDEDGDMICFKKIRDDYTDCHTGTISNKVGLTVSVPRRDVDEDMDATCSYGLHVCSRSYLSSFRGNRVVKCKVDPSDVVAIPRDYNNSKMRVCKYTVLEEIHNTY